MRRANTRYGVLALLLCGAVALLLLALSGSSPPQRQGRARRPRATASARARSAPLSPAAPAEVDYGRYQVIVKRSIFGGAAPATAGGATMGLPPLLPETWGPPPPPPPPPPPQPVVEPPLAFPGWSYVGYIRLDGKTLGIVQNESDGSAEHLEVGRNFRGATVEAITPTEIKLRSGTRIASLLRPETFSLVPLDRGPSGTAPGRGGPTRGGRGGPPT